MKLDNYDIDLSRAKFGDRYVNSKGDVLIFWYRRSDNNSTLFVFITRWSIINAVAYVYADGVYRRERLFGEIDVPEEYIMCKIGESFWENGVVIRLPRCEANTKIKTWPSAVPELTHERIKFGDMFVDNQGDICIYWFTDDGLNRFISPTVGYLMGKQTVFNSLGLHMTLKTQQGVRYTRAGGYLADYCSYDIDRNVYIAGKVFSNSYGTGNI